MIKSVIAEVSDGRDQHRDVRALIGIMIHRTGVDLQAGFVLGHTASEICDAFLGRVPQWKEVAKATGGQNAYTLFVGGDVGPQEYDGQVWQALHLDEIGHHARRFSRPYLGIGCIGDFREVPPSSRQWTTTVDLAADLCLVFGFGADRVNGHGEVPGAHGGAKAPGKPAACPGDLWNMEHFRDEVSVVIAAKSAHDAKARLVNDGMIFP